MMAIMQSFDSTRQVIDRTKQDWLDLTSQADFWKRTAADLADVVAAAMIQRGIDSKKARDLAATLKEETDLLESALRQAAQACVAITNVVSVIEGEVAQATSDRPRMEVN